MQVIVVTGGIGAGKSTAARFLAEKGAVDIDLDVVAAHLLEPGHPELERVVEEFGAGVLNADGTLNRAALAAVAFDSPQSVARLNAIVHPAVAREVGPAVQDMRLLPDPPAMIVLQVPLLAEAPVFAELADVVIAIEAPEEMRVARSVGFGRAEPDARRRLALQATDAERAELADIRIANTGTADDLRRELERVWHERLAVGGQR
jgi:dephospho-CoA kinase